MYIPGPSRTWPCSLRTEKIDQTSIIEIYQHAENAVPATVSTRPNVKKSLACTAAVMLSKVSMYPSIGVGVAVTVVVVVAVAVVVLTSVTVVVAVVVVVFVLVTVSVVVTGGGGGYGGGYGDGVGQ